VQAVKPSAPVSNTAEAIRETIEALVEAGLAVFFVFDSKIFPVKLILFLHPAARAAFNPF
jgi:hypothetical protein